MNIIAIPARLNSTRCHKKLIRKINNRPLIEYTIQQALKSSLVDKVILLSEDQEILSSIYIKDKKFIGFLTGKSESGTDRIIKSLNDEIQPEDIVVNWQGDEPLFNHYYVDVAIEHLKQNPQINVETFVSVASTQEEQNPNAVKVVFNKKQEALYFSRLNIPHGAKIHHVHHGIYVFKGATLHQIELMDKLHNSSESLEQLRWLENKINIYCHLIDKQPKGIDTEDDLKAFTRNVSRY